MKFVHLLFLLLVGGISAFAQATVDNTSALGVYGETNSMFSGIGNPVVSTAGLQYNKWTKKHIGFVVTLGYGNYVHDPASGLTVLIGPDTLKTKTVNSNVNLGMVGFGIQAERRFYKKVYFFAGIQLRAGYGSGKTDTTMSREYNYTQIDPVTGFTYQNTATSSYNKTGTGISMFYLGFTPSIGAKLEFKKFCVGTEFMNYFTYRSLKPNNGTASNMVDFDFGNITQRLFVQYKF